jgi:hypothetical protein
MYQTGLQNPIFGLINNMNMNNNGNNMNNNNGMMNNNMNNMNNMNGMMGNGFMNNGMNYQAGMNMNGPMNYQGNMGMMNPQVMMNFNQMSQMNQSANQFNNSFNNSNNNQTNVNQNTSSYSNNSGGINVFFRKNGENEEDTSIMIQCKTSDKISDLIDRYRTKSLDNDPTKKFIFNAKEVIPHYTVEQQGIRNNASIFVVTTANVRGA